MHAFWKELCNPGFALKDRIRLFDAIITPTVLYGSCSWSMRKDRERKLIVAQRRMLRRLCCVQRRAQEDWVDWMKRATAVVENQMSSHGLEYWTHGQRRKSWRWAQKVTRMDKERWAQILATWEPTTGNRCVGRPCKRSSDAFDNFLASLDNVSTLEWFICAQDRTAWDAHEQGFVLDVP